VLSATHIPGHVNVVAHRESRYSNIDTQWKLDGWIFERLCGWFGVPDIDLFASRINALLPTYVSWKPDPGAKYIDTNNRI
jgi:hypothetical protein